MSKKPSNASKAVAVVEEKSPLAVPDFMKNDAGMGRETIDRSMLAIPRITLMHATSMPVQDGLVSPGEWWHNILQQTLGSEIVVTPIFIEKGYTLWNPKAGENEVLARGVMKNGVWVWDPSNATFEVEIDRRKVKWETKSTIAESRLAKWGNKNDPPPPAKESINMLVAVHGHEGVFGVVTFSKTSFPIGRKLLQAIHAKAGVPLFGLKYEFSSASTTSKSGNRHLIPKWIPAGLVDDPSFYDACKNMYEQVRETGLGMAAHEEANDGAGDETVDDSSVNF